jgi:hypothetical protein
MPQKKNWQKKKKKKKKKKWSHYPTHPTKNTIKKTIKFGMVGWGEGVGGNI